MIDRRNLLLGVALGRQSPGVAGLGRHGCRFNRLAAAKVARTRLSDTALGEHQSLSTLESNLRTFTARTVNISFLLSSNFPGPAAIFDASEWKWLHPMLMDLLFVLHWKYNKNEINIYSGYRTPETNANIEGAALHSQHTLAKALDIHLPDTDNAEVAKSFKTFIYGGVGMYPQKHFTHLDCGPLRSWVG